MIEIQSSNTEYYLIASEDERKWRHDCPVLFLGEWCRWYDRKKSWGSMNAIVAAPYGVKTAEKDADYLLARELESKIFPVLCDLLNSYHGVNRPERFWRILVGKWFRTLINIVINRYKTIEQCLVGYKISGTSISSGPIKVQHVKDFYEFMQQVSNSDWNDEIYRKILIKKNCAHLLGGAQLLSSPLDVQKRLNTDQWKVSRLILEFKRFTKTCIKSLIYLIYKACVKKNDPMFISPCISFRTLAKIFIKFRAFPAVSITRKVDYECAYGEGERSLLSKKIQDVECGDLEAIVRALTFELIPMCYLEGYKLLVNGLQKQHWPKAPKVIFTSNDFEFNEHFKLWSAVNSTAGSLYVIGQHGNNYGTHRYLVESIEEITADIFVTWGWHDGHISHHPGYIFTTNDKVIKQVNRNKLILLQQPHDIRRRTWDVSFEIFKYFKEQEHFYSNLDRDLRKKLIVRLPPGYNTIQSDYSNRWMDISSEVSIDNGELPIENLYKNARLVVCAYDSTAILELLSLNLPALFYWEGGMDHLRDSAKPYYSLLVSAGIIHFSGKAAANYVNSIWSEVDGWWNSVSVQSARATFCNRYARKVEGPERLIFDLFEAGCAKKQKETH